MVNSNPLVSRKHTFAQLSAEFSKRLNASSVGKYAQDIVRTILLLMFPLGYLESLRWPVSPPKATHGILKGLFLLLVVTLVLLKPSLFQKQTRNERIIMALFLLSFALSAFFSLVPETSLLFLWFPLIVGAVMAGFSGISFTRKHILIFISVSIVLVVFTFAFAFFSLMFRYEIDNIYYFLFLDHRANHLLSELRRYGKYVSLGPYIMLLPISAVFLVDRTSSVTRKLLSLLAVLVGVLTAVISNNRIDAIVVGIQLLVLFWFIPRRLAVILLVTAMSMVQLGLFTTEKFFGFNLEERFLRPQYERDLETVDMRFTYWQTAFYNFKKHPVFGTGPNTYNEVSDFPFRRYYDQGTREYTVRPDTGIGIHNLFIERLADTGLIGFSAFIIMLFYFAKMDVLRIIRKRTRTERARYILFSLGSWSWILYGITDNGYGAQGFVTFFFLRGILNHL